MSARYRFHFYDFADDPELYEPDARYVLAMHDEMDWQHLASHVFAEAEIRYHVERKTLTEMLRRYRAKLKTKVESGPTPEKPSAIESQPTGENP